MPVHGPGGQGRDAATLSVLYTGAPRVFSLEKNQLLQTPPPTILGTYLHLGPSKEVVSELGE